MANIRFVLNGGRKNLEKDKEYPITIRYVHGRNVNFTRSIGFKLKPSNWDSKNSKPKDNKETWLVRDAIVDRIDDLEDEFKKFDRDNKSKGIIPSYHDVKELFESLKIDRNELEKEEKGKTSLKDLFNRYCEEPDSNPSTRKSYKTTWEFLKEFGEQDYPINGREVEGAVYVKGGTPDFEHINTSFYNRLKVFGANRMKRNKNRSVVKNSQYKGVTTNYFAKIISNSKAVLREGERLGLVDKRAFEQWKVVKKESKRVYLTIKELDKLYFLELEPGSAEERVRDLFLIGAWTGLRVSDFKQLKPDNFKEEDGYRYIEHVPKKTILKNKTVLIPVSYVVEQILNRNNGLPPKSVGDQVINNVIRDLCVRAGIIEDTRIWTYILNGGVTSDEVQMKGELVTSHTARRSFATNAYLSQTMEALDIMMITGHTKLDTFLNYVQADAKEAFSRYRDSSYWKHEPQKE